MGKMDRQNVMGIGEKRSDIFDDKGGIKTETINPDNLKRGMKIFYGKKLDSITIKEATKM